MSTKFFNNQDGNTLFEKLKGIADAENGMGDIFKVFQAVAGHIRIRGGDFHILPEHLRALPLPPAPPETQSRIARLVDRILSTKSRPPSADTTPLESQIDTLVYPLYGLTEEEIAAVGGNDVTAS